METWQHAFVTLLFPETFRQTLRVLELMFDLFLFLAGGPSPNVKKTDEQRLLEVLLNGYNSDTRPVFNASHPVQVSLGITLTQIFDVVSDTDPGNDYLLAVDYLSSVSKF